MNQTLFLEKAEALLRSVEDAPALEEADPDRNGNVLTLEFDSGEQLVINIQVPTQQVWLASRASGGFHFSYDEQSGWTDSQGRRFWETLSEAASLLAGHPVDAAGR